MIFRVGSVGDRGEGQIFSFFLFLFFKEGNSLSLFHLDVAFLFCFVAPLPHLTSDDVDKALQNSPRLMHARNTGNAGPAPCPQDKCRLLFTGHMLSRWNMGQPVHQEGRRQRWMVEGSLVNLGSVLALLQPLWSLSTPLLSLPVRGFLSARRRAGLASSHSLSLLCWVTVCCSECSKMTCADYRN